MWFCQRQRHIYETGLQCLIVPDCTFFSCYTGNHDINYFLYSLQPTLNMVLVTYNVKSRTQMKYIVTITLTGWLIAVAPAEEVRALKGLGSEELFLSVCSLLGYDSLLSSVWLQCTKLQVGNPKDSTLIFHDSENFNSHPTAHYIKVSVFIRMNFLCV